MATQWALRFLHVLYAISMTIVAWMKRRQSGQPAPLTAQRNKIPKHLCLNLVADNDMHAGETEDAFLQCIQSVAAWCSVLGIETLTVYDRYGVLYGCSTSAYRRVFVANEPMEDSCESEVEYPLTPPLSECSSSRSHTPEHAMLPVESNVITMMHSSRLRKRRNVAVRRRLKGMPCPSSNSVLRIVSRASGKPAVVAATRALLQDCVSVATVSDDAIASQFPYHLTVSRLGMVLEDGLPPPDFMIIHQVGDVKRPPMELYGFPPWQITLTEFHCTHLDGGPECASGSKSLSPPRLISEVAFCRALDEYAGAQFRLGR